MAAALDSEAKSSQPIAIGHISTRRLISVSASPGLGGHSGVCNDAIGEYGLFRVEGNKGAVRIRCVADSSYLTADTHTDSAGDRLVYFSSKKCGERSEWEIDFNGSQACLFMSKAFGEYLFPANMGSGRLFLHSAKHEKRNEWSLLPLPDDFQESDLRKTFNLHCVASSSTTSTNSKVDVSVSTSGGRTSVHAQAGTSSDASAGPKEYLGYSILTRRFSLEPVRTASKFQCTLTLSVDLDAPKGGRSALRLVRGLHCATAGSAHFTGHFAESVMDDAIYVCTDKGMLVGVDPRGNQTVREQGDRNTDALWTVVNRNQGAAEVRLALGEFEITYATKEMFTAFKSWWNKK